MTKEVTTAIAVGGLWITFALVCLGLAAMGGRGPLLVVKLRLGGLLLGLMAATSMTSSACCYETEYYADYPDTDPGLWDTGGPDCEDGLDNDGDGWTDGDDPDCLEGTREIEYSWTACNDGRDNDGDGLVDSDDGDCRDGVDNNEAP
jgi:hypothetical protein